MNQRFLSLKKPMGGLFLLVIVLVGFFLYRKWVLHLNENKILKEMLTRLEADSRIAEVFVTDVQYNPLLQKHQTTIKFLEYDSQGQSLPPKYFTFTGNIIQFQSLVVRFEDQLVKRGDSLKGKSVYLFWKVFMLDGPRTEEYPITSVKTIPQGYKLEGPPTQVEKEFWKHFWDLALNKKLAQGQGIKNAQIEAPGSQFIPGVLYTLTIEHDGGIRIDTSPIPEIYRGEMILPVNPL